MQIKDYVTSILDVISSCPFVESQNLSFEERPPNAAYLTGTIVFINGSKMHFKEFFVFKPGGVKVLKYGYSYLRKDDSLIFRYDNALDPKAKMLPTYPEHKHLPTELLPAQRLSLGDILKQVAYFIEQSKEL